jgi:hypothetical protein
MKPFKAWTFQNVADPEQRYTLYSAEEPNWKVRIASAGQEFTLVESKPVVFHMQGKAESIARELFALTGTLWEYDHYSDHPEVLNRANYYLTRATDKLRVYFDTDFNGKNKGRWTFSYTRPRGPEGYIEIYDPARPDYRLKNPEISVAASRGAGAIAADIVRRLLPDAEKMHPEILNRVASQINAKQNQKDVLRMMAEALGEPEPNPGRDSFYFTYGGSQDCKANYGGSVDLTFRSLPPKLAFALAKWLKQNSDSK